MASSTIELAMIFNSIGASASLLVQSLTALPVSRLGVLRNRWRYPRTIHEEH